MTNEFIGKQIKKARVEESMSQSDLGGKLGVSWEMISRYENGKSSALRHLLKLSKILDKPVSYFTNDDTTEPNIPTEDINEIKQMVTELKDSSRSFIKLIPDLSGRGIDQDINGSNVYLELSSDIYHGYDELFALDLNTASIDINTDIDTQSQVVLTKTNSASEGELVISYDGITYTLSEYDPDQPEAVMAKAILAILRFD
jgi:transcriptional regulator with XRE-family HTH domain